VMSKWPIRYLIYIIVWDCLIVGIFSYAVFILGHSGWWFVLAVCMSRASVSSLWGMMFYNAD